ncbi:hypothetical protein [Pseudomonas sp. OV226]|uniref:hypothetical protein n=1 Tax=Pseudomonas sp. OV226 TaxID=2135588 RepID=UPI000D799CDA|nr:hypothetical protein [Pseudomonas sp. OV226]PWK42246.1 hypothetical protein C7534_10553 [Pseudomonas sp. OV226]
MGGFKLRKHGYIFCFVAAIILQGCMEKDLTPEQKAYVASLETELAQTKQDIDAGTRSAAVYSGGLIKDLISTRVEILKTNQALLEQRILAVQSQSSVTIATVTSKVDEDLASKLSVEITQAKAGIASAKAEAAQYSGGLIQALKLSTVATSEQTLAMLEQQYLVAKYGLNPIRVSALPSSALSAVPTTSTAPPQLLAKSNLLPPGSGPFGFEAGISGDAIEKMTGEAPRLAKESENLYLLDRAPKPNDAFEQYGLVISPTVGLCVVRGISKTIQTNDFGHQLQAAYGTMKDALTSIYGKPKTYDFLMPSSIWKDSNDWMTGLYKQDRTLAAEWRGPGIKNDINSISIDARALSRDKGYFVVEYTFNNSPECTAELKKQKNDSL